ncbi:MAG TPA: acyl-ACP--UDP-N-acetylglucosamine O-acyltransferase [Gammaproteobacteria bacterium]|nr:acyl-ACP--UDP-N-acetylglucosamine O-acyltransferase [Gammaproteobacteria bacterium]
MSDLHSGTLIHPTAVLDPAARVAADVIIGPYSVIGAGVEIAGNCWLGAHVVIGGTTLIGSGSKIFPFASLGSEPQDKKYQGESTRLEIGCNNTIREYVTINRGTLQDAGVTRLGDDNWIMACVHIAHDCRIGSNTVLANNTTLAGHVHIGDYATLGGASLVHQFCHIGEYAFTAYGARINKNVPPFVMMSEGKSRPRGLNIEGLKRCDFSDDRIRWLKEAYRILYRSDLSLEKAIEELGRIANESKDVLRLREFLSASDRSIVR